MLKMLSLTSEDLKAAEREMCKRSFSYFVERAWDSIIPDKFQNNWHIDAVCDHLQAVANGEFNRLLINVPPGTSKSTLVNVMYPAWLWGPYGKPYHKHIGASHEQGLAVRDSRMMRNLITSEWYQSLWPIALTGDQNEKLYFENQHKGFRQACAVSSMTGRRGHMITWDDPLSAEKAHSEVERENVLRIFRETLPTRLNDPVESAIVLIMQRLHEDDPAGYIVENDLGYEHLMIPMEFEPDRKCYTRIGWEDPRSKEGELLDPVRFPQEVIDRDKKAMGSYAWAGQMQQRPAPDGGGFFKAEWFRYYDTAPKHLRIYGTSDYATKEGKGDFTVHTVWGVDPDSNIYLLDLWRGQTDSLVWVENLLSMARQWKPQEWGEESGQIINSMGPVIDRRQRETSNFFYRKQYPSTTDKSVRAQSFRAYMAMGKVYFPKNSAFIPDLESELLAFPTGRHDDQVDTCSLIGRMLDRLLTAEKTVTKKERPIHAMPTLQEITDEMDARFEQQREGENLS